MTIGHSACGACVTVTIVETSNVGVMVGMVGRGVMDAVGVAEGSAVRVEVVGIREAEVELQGDYSGGTNAVLQKDWLPIKGLFRLRLVCPEHQKDNKNSEVTVITWNSISGVHKKTGVKIDAAAHYNFTLTSDNKIKRMLEYANSKVFDEIRAGFTTRTNGTIYNHHENINTVRKSMYAFEKGDVDKALSYFADNVKFFDINWPFDSSINKAQAKADWQQFINDYEIIKIEEDDIEAGDQHCRWQVEVDCGI